MNEPLKGFITYSHENAEAKNELRKRLAVMEQNNELVTWDDGQLTPGDEALQEDILEKVADSDLLLYLVSAASLASKNCNRELAKASKEELRIIPIILEDCDWLHHQLSGFEVLPHKGKPINEWQPKSKVWQNIVDGIRKAVHEMQFQAKPSPNVTPEEIETLAFLAFHRGNFMMMLDQIDEALKDYSRAIELNPNNAAVYTNRGIAYGEKGEPDLAIKDFNTSIQFNPDHAETYYCRGVAYDMKSDVDHAFKDYTKAIQLKPDYANAYTNRGNAYNNKGRLNSAIEDLNKAIRLAPHDAKAYTNRGKSYGKKGEYDRAIKNFKKAIQLDPDLAEAHNNLGLTYLKKGEVEFAIKNFDKAIQLKPDYANAHRNRSWIWLNLHEWEKARSDLTIAKNMGVNIITLFQNSYSSVADFEQKQGVKLPEDIAALLTPP